MLYTFTLEEKKAWEKLNQKLLQRFRAKKVTLETFLLLIGINELGQVPRTYSKEEKMDLIHIGTCTVLALGGYYTQESKDSDGWPHYQLIKPLPALENIEQINLLRYWILKYFSVVFDDLFE